MNNEFKIKQKMVILVGCEESQAVTIELRQLGHEAFSCDVRECSGGHPEWHIKFDLIKVLKGGFFLAENGDEIYVAKWDMGIFHPPCTYMSRAGARWMYPTAGNLCQDRYAKAMEAKDFFLKCLNSEIPLIAIENPLPLKVVGLPKETQVIQPYEYGHEYSKRTHLWLKGLPTLKPTDIKESFVPYLPSNTGGKKRGQKATFKNITQKESSKTFEGIAKAMAEQWGGFLHTVYTQERGLLT